MPSRPSAPRWTAADLPDLTGRHAVVTGATSGLGQETARELARAGASVTMACRDPRRAEAALSQVQRTAADAQRVRTGALDLADLASVRAFAATVGEPIDLLINNAGVMAIPRRGSADGFELQFATNHLGHYALTALLLPRLLAAAAPRVVTVSSQAHRMGRMDFSDLMGERRYQPWRAYGQSKLANLLFTSELQRRSNGAGSPLRAMAAHPGYAATNLQAVGPTMSGRRLSSAFIGVANGLLGQPAAMGALPTLYAAVADIPGDSYVGPDGPFEQRGHPRLVGRSAAASDVVAAERLWEESARLTGVTWAF